MNWREIKLIFKIVTPVALFVMFLSATPTRMLKQIYYQFKYAPVHASTWSYCVSCLDRLPHKKMTPVSSKWVCEECIKLYTWRVIKENAYQAERVDARDAYKARVKSHRQSLYNERENAATRMRQQGYSEHLIPPVFSTDKEAIDRMERIDKIAEDIKAGKYE